MTENRFDKYFQLLDDSIMTKGTILFAKQAEQETNKRHYICSHPNAPVPKIDGSLEAIIAHKISKAIKNGQYDTDITIYHKPDSSKDPELRYILECAKLYLEHVGYEISLTHDQESEYKNFNYEYCSSLFISWRNTK